VWTKLQFQSQSEVHSISASFPSIELTSTGSGPKRCKAADVIDSDDILIDIAVTSAAKPSTTRRDEKTRDVNAFFDEPKLVTLGDGSTKLYRICKHCL